MVTKASLCLGSSVLGTVSNSECLQRRKTEWKCHGCIILSLFSRERPFDSHSTVGVASLSNGLRLAFSSLLIIVGVEHTSGLLGVLGDSRNSRCTWSPHVALAKIGNCFSSKKPTLHKFVWASLFAYGWRQSTTNRRPGFESFLVNNDSKVFETISIQLRCCLSTMVDCTWMQRHWVVGYWLWLGSKDVLCTTIAVNLQWRFQKVLVTFSNID